MRTFQNVADRARLTLNDPDSVRHTNSELLGYANDAVLLLRRARPDLFVGNWTIPNNEYGLSDPLPVPDTFFGPVVDYVISRAEFREDEETMQQRAAAFLQIAMGAL